MKLYFHNRNLSLIYNEYVVAHKIILYAVAGQDISLVRTEPDDPQQLPCPHQRQEFQCQIMTPVFSLVWSLPNDEILEFGVLRNVGDVRISLDGNYTATLTDKRAHDGDRFFYTSTILVLEPVNGSNLTCRAVDGSLQLEKRIVTAISGIKCNLK